MLKGVTPGHVNPFSWASFARTGWTHPEGLIPAHVVEARVYNVNMVNWTVDAQAIFDQRNFWDVQVGSPYLHPTSGEGIYCVPEVGAKCTVCIPSDGTAPYVLSFVMPMESTPSTAEEGEEDGNKGYTYAGGRSRGKPGDLVMRGRDGNFMILHRGGVAQFGSSALAQRICVPITNLMTDISQTYNHYNSAGTINWGIQDRGSENPGAEQRSTYRVYANDEYADIRVNFGRVRSPVPEPSEGGMSSDLQQLGIGTSEDTVFEFALARDGFETDSGEFKGSPADVYVRAFMDRAGGCGIRFEGALNLRVKKKVRLRVDDNVEIFGGKTILLEADQLLSLLGKSGVKIGTSGATVVLNEGQNPVAHIGSQVKVSIAPPGIQAFAIIPPSTAPQPIMIVQGVMNGVVLSGNSTILV